MSSNEAKGADCVVTGYHNGKFMSVLLRGEKSRREARAYGEHKGWKDIRVIQALVFATGLFAGVVADRTHAAPLDDAKQYAMVLSAADIMGDAQCNVPTTAMTKGRLVANGIDVRGRDSAQFLVTMDAVAQIYLSDPKAFCQRARVGR